MEGFCFDGALFSALRRYLSVKIRLYYLDPCPELKPGSDDVLMDLSNIAFFVKCWHHSLSNAITKGLEEVLSLADDEEQIFVANQALVEGGGELRQISIEFID